MCVKRCADCEHGEDIECATVYLCELTGEKHYADDCCPEFSEWKEEKN